MHKVRSTVEEAIADITDGVSVAIGGFGATGAPFRLMQALVASRVRDIEIISNNGALFEWGLGPMLQQGRVRRVIASHIGKNKSLEKAFRKGEVEVELTPQGSLAERLRAGGAGIPSFYTPSGVDTMVESGMPWRYNPDGTVARFGPGKERRVFDGRAFLLETSIRPDITFVRAQYGDPAGNLVYNESARNFNPPFASAGGVTIAEVEHLVGLGEIDPAAVHTPGIFVSRVVEVGSAQKWFDQLVVRDRLGPPVTEGDEALRHFIARRAALDLLPGEYVNLGIGIPTLLPLYLSGQDGIYLQSENGILGLGPPPSSADEASYDLTNAGKETATLVPGASFFDSVTSFSMIRGGHLDVSVLGAFQVSATGDLANWMVPGRSISGMGGAMDLAAGARRILVTMLHTDAGSVPKIVPDCTFPLTAKGVVDRIITELAVLDVRPGGLVLRELAPGVTVEHVRSVTGVEVHVPVKPLVMASLTPDGAP